MKELSDNELAKRFKETKDKKYFEEIYLRLSEKIYRFVYTKVGDRDVAEDITSETFFAFLDSIDRFNFNSKLSTFVFGIALNKTRQYWQQKGKKKEVEYIDEITNEIEQSDDPEAVQKREITLSKELRSIIKDLPDKQRDVLLERFVNSHSIKETAKILSLSEGNVRVIQNRALKKAREIALRQGIISK